MEKLILFLIIISCADFRNELDKKKASEEKLILNSEQEKIKSIDIKEGKVYGINFDKDLKSTYKKISKKITDRNFEEYLKDYNNLNNPKKDFIIYIKENYVKNVPVSLHKKLKEAKNIDDIKKVLIKGNGLALLLNRPYAFKIERDKIYLYMPQGIKFDPKWITTSLSYNWKVTEEVIEGVKDGIYFINDQYFQIIEIENIKIIDLEICRLKDKNKTFEDELENNI